MRSFLEWFDDKGFWAEEYWDAAAGEMKTGGGWLVLHEEQRRVLGHCLTPDASGVFPYVTIVYSAPKKSGKTAIAAAITCWFAEEAQNGTQIFVIANDEEQAKDRVYADVNYHVQHGNPEAITYTGKIDFPNGGKIQALPREHKSASGSRHAMTVWDELWGVTSENARRMWVEMTPVPTMKISLRVVVTYAGYENESELLWDMYLRGVGSDEHPDGRGETIPELEDLPCWKAGKQFTYWTHEHIMPWQTEEYYDEQSEDLRASDMLRMHYNRWVSGHEEFLPPEWWDAATKAYPQSAEIWANHPYRLYPIYVGVDVAPKHDCSAVVGVAYDAKIGKVVMVFHRIWDPKGKEIDLEKTVEAYLIDHKKRFKIQSVHYDPYQLHRSMMTLRGKGLNAIEFAQTADNMTSASQSLWTLLKNNNLMAYPDPEARAHIKNAVAASTPRGFRIIKDPAIKKGSRHMRTRRPIDFSVALAMACYAATEIGAVDTSQPIRIESPYSDVTAWKTSQPDEVNLPWMFQSN